MAWSTPSSLSTGTLVTAATWNQDVKDNAIALRAGSIALASQAIGDLTYASSTTQLARVAAVAAGQVLTSAGTGTVPAYSATPALTSVDMGGTTVYGSRAITVDTGGVLNVVLASSAGDDFTVDGNRLVVSGDETAVGINTAAPVSLLDVRGPTGTGAAPAGLLTLATNELTIVDNDQLGRIDFRAPIATAGTDAIVTAASIWSEANATFSASVNSADIVFATAETGAAVEHLRLDSRGTMRYGYEGTGKGTFQNEAWGTVLGNNAYYNGSAWVAVATGASSNITQGSAGDIIFRSAPSVSAGASTSAVDNVTINANGYVGIGIVATHKLHVSGDIKLQASQVHLSDGYGLLWGDNGLNGNAATDSLRFDTAGGARLTINSAGLVTVGNNLSVTGNVGIGTAAPGAKLVVAGATDNSGMLRVQSTSDHAINTGGSIAFIGNNTAGSVSPGTWGVIRGYDESAASANGNGYMAFDVSVDGAGLTERMRITSAGRLGIGTSAPQAPLSVSNGGAAGFELNPALGTIITYNRSTSAYAPVSLNGSSITFFIAGATKMSVTAAGNVAIAGALSKGSGSFLIDHPLPALADTHQLVHSFVESPKADLIYRGTVVLVDGAATVDLDVAAGMTAGTWVLLCRDEQVFTSNETSYNHIRGSVSGSTLTIECEEATCTDSVSWLVVAERQDQHMLDTDWTDDDGRPIIEPLKPETEPPSPEPDPEPDPAP